MEFGSRRTDGDFVRRNSRLDSGFHDSDRYGLRSIILVLASDRPKNGKRDRAEEGGDRKPESGGCRGWGRMAGLNSVQDGHRLTYQNECSDKRKKKK